MPRNHKIQIRRDTAANWTSTDPVLAAGEVGLVTDTNELVVGDGSTAFSSLSRFVDEAALSGTYSPASAAAVLGLDQVVAHDRFNRADGSLGTSDSGHTWTSDVGTWAVLSNRARCSALSSGLGVATIDPGVADLTVNAVVSATGDGIVLRCIDGSNFLMAVLSTTQVQLWKREAGSFSSLTNAGIVSTSGRLHRLEVTADGATIVVLVDGALRVTYTMTAGDLTTFGSATKVGFRASSTSSRFDSLAVRTLIQ